MEGEGVNQNFSEGDIVVPMEIYSSKHIISDENDNEALSGGSDLEPLSLYLSESGDDSDFIFSDDDTKCNDRDEDNIRHDKEISQSNLDPESILDMNSNSKHPYPDVVLQPISRGSAEGIETNEVDGEKTMVKVRTGESDGTSAVGSVCYICGDSVLEGEDYDCHLKIVHNKSSVLEEGGTKEKDEVEVSRKAEAQYDDLNRNQSSDNQISVTATAPLLKCYLCDLGKSRLSRSVFGESFHLHLENTGRLGKGNPSERNVSNLASYLRVSLGVAHQVLEHLGVCKETVDSQSRLSFILRMCWDNMDCLSDLSNSFEHVWKTVNMLKDAHEISQEILGHVYTWKCLFGNDSYFKTFLRDIHEHIHHGQDRAYTFTRNIVVEVVDLESESANPDLFKTKSGASMAQPKLGATPGFSSVALVSVHPCPKNKFKCLVAPYTNSRQIKRPPSNVNNTSLSSETHMYSTRQLLSTSVPYTPSQYDDKSHYQHPAAAFSGSPHHHNASTHKRPQHTLQSVAKALIDLVNQKGPKRVVHTSLTNEQIEGLRMLGIQEI